MFTICKAINMIFTFNSGMVTIQIFTFNTDRVINDFFTLKMFTFNTGNYIHDF